MSRTTKRPQIDENAAPGVKEKRLELPDSNEFVTDWAIPSQDFTHTQVLLCEAGPSDRTQIKTTDLFGCESIYSGKR